METTCGDELIKRFERNFDKSAYNKALIDLTAKLDIVESIEDMLDLFDEYNGTEDDEDSVFLEEVELDRSSMETEADYVSVEFWISWNSKNKKPCIWRVGLYTTEEDGDIICYFDPYTLEIQM